MVWDRILHQVIYLIIFNLLKQININCARFAYKQQQQKQIIKKLGK